jgi:hypothetical protein
MRFNVTIHRPRYLKVVSVYEQVSADSRLVSENNVPAENDGVLRDARCERELARGCTKISINMTQRYRRGTCGDEHVPADRSLKLCSARNDEYITGSASVCRNTFSDKVQVALHAGISFKRMLRTGAHHRGFTYDDGAQVCARNTYDACCYETCGAYERGVA